MDLKSCPLLQQNKLSCLPGEYACVYYSSVALHFFSSTLPRVLLVLTVSSVACHNSANNL